MAQNGNEERLYQKYCGAVLRECGGALNAVDPDTVEQYLSTILEAKRVFFVGVGRVLLALEAVAKRYVHLGIDAVVVGQVTEPAITEGDVLVVGSGSGERVVPLAIAGKARSFGAKVVHIGSVPESPMNEFSDLFVRIPAQSVRREKGEVSSVQPMTTLFEQSLLLFGDVTALMIAEKRRLNMDGLWRNHANLE